MEITDNEVIQYFNFKKDDIAKTIPANCKLELSRIIWGLYTNIDITIECKLTHLTNTKYRSTYRHVNVSKVEVARVIRRLKLLNLQ